MNRNNWNLNGNWFSPDRQKQYQVNLISREAPQKNDPSKNSYRSTIYQSETEGLYAETKKTHKIRSFEISDSNGNLIQKITSLDQCISDHQVEIEFEDLNFDGILDLKILKIFPDRIKNYYAFLYFIYNPETKKYVRNSKLETLEVLSFEPANKVMVRYEADGRGNESTFNYKWEANEPFLIKKETSFENDSYTYYTEYQIIGRKSVKVKEYKKK
nr:hypothetical protein [Pedobacter sp. ASV19]